MFSRTAPSLDEWHATCCSAALTVLERTRGGAMRFVLGMGFHCCAAGLVAAVALASNSAHACTQNRPNCGTCWVAVCLTTDNSWDCRPANTSTSCNDGNVCTVNDHCDGQGNCVGGAPAATSTACDDHNLCTWGDHCDGTGRCTGNPIDCSNTSCSTRACNGTSQCTTTGYYPSTTKCRDPVGQCDVADYCTGSSDVCPNAYQPNGTPCNDGNACTSGETCQNGACGSPTSTVTCGPPDQCHTGAGSCQPSTGICTYANAPNGTACNDGSVCTSGETCQNGLCGSPTAISCSYPVIAYSYDQIGNITTQSPSSCLPATCSTLGIACGSASDGCGGTVSCGGCPTGQVCLASNSCCTPTTCAAQGKTCGTIPDGCGGTLSCGGCGTNQVCGGSNTCVCASGYGDCSGTGTCSSLMNDAKNCGACGVVCTSTSSTTHGVCSSGYCWQMCNAGLHDCGDGRCIPTTTLCP